MKKSIIANPMVLTHYGWPLEKALALLAEIGFGRIELCRPDLAGWLTPDLRGQLADHDLVAFVADGSRLPRRSGIDDRPLQSHAISWQSPPSLRVELEQADGTRITGTAHRLRSTCFV